MHASVHDELVGLVAERAAAIKLGDPNHPETEMGPVANKPQYQKVLGYLRTAQEEGAAVACGGAPHTGLGGLFIKPTVLTGVGPESTVVREEIFGPVLSAYTFTDEDEALKLANDTPVRAGQRGVDQEHSPRPPGRGQAPRRNGVDQRIPGSRAERAFRRLRSLRARQGKRNRGHR